jgi:rod shape-determining protein MreD
MKNLIAIPVLALAFMIQTAIVSRITLLSGAADIVLLILIAWALQEQVQSALHWAALAGLMAAFVSGLAPGVLLIAYMLAVILARYVLRQTWQTPVLALFTVTFFSTLLLHLITYLALMLRGTSIPFGDALALITLPSVFLNFLVALPIHSFIRDLALWVYPPEDMV